MSFRKKSSMKSSKKALINYSFGRSVSRRIIKFSMHALIQEIDKYHVHLRSNNPVPMRYVERVIMYYIGPAPVLPKNMKIPPHVSIVPDSEIYSSGSTKLI